MRLLSLPQGIHQDTFPGRLPFSSCRLSNDTSQQRFLILKDSDVDLLVVMPVEGSKRQKASEIDLALADRTLPLDVIVVTPEEVEKYRNTAGSLIYPALKEGKVVYERVA